jgi:hypothetical protein
MFSASLTGGAVYTTPSGDFTVTMGNLTASNLAGLMLSYSVTAKVTDVTGVAADLVLRVTQSYAVNAPIFMAIAPTMMVTFVDADGAPHHNQISARLDIADLPLDSFVASDTGAPSGMTQTIPGTPLSSPPNVFAATSPMNVVTPIIFEFDVAPMAGDSIAIPITFRIGNVPEPPAWALMLVGFAGLGAAAKMARMWARAPALRA